MGITQDVPVKIRDAGFAEAVALATKGLSSESPLYRGCSVQAIGQMLMRGSLSGVSVISHITGCFEDSDPKVRECAAHAFGHMGEEASKVAYLLHGLSEEDESQPVRDAAKNSVRKLTTRGIFHEKVITRPSTEQAKRDHMHCFKRYCSKGSN